MHSDPNVKALFLKANPQLDTDIALIDDVLWTRCEENYMPGILLKTVQSFQYCLDNFDGFEYVFRTNLSSFCDFKAMQRFVNTLPKQSCYCGVITTSRHGERFASGAGFFMSKDVVQTICQGMSLDAYGHQIDDVAIGDFLAGQNIYPINAPRLKISSYSQLNLWKQHRNKHKDLFHYRLKCNSLRSSVEIAIYADLVNAIYGIPASKSEMLPVHKAKTAGKARPRARPVFRR